MKAKLTKKRVASQVRKNSLPASAPAIDKERFHEMREAYRQSGVEKERERIRASRNRTPTQAFQSFLELWKFGHQFAERDTWSAKEKVASFERYYDRMKKFEAGRRARAG